MHACMHVVQAYMPTWALLLGAYAKLAASTRRLLDSILFVMNEVAYCKTGRACMAHRLCRQGPQDSEVKDSVKAW